MDGGRVGIRVVFVHPASHLNRQLPIEWDAPMLWPGPDRCHLFASRRPGGGYERGDASMVDVHHFVARQQIMARQDRVGHSRPVTRQPERWVAMEQIWLPGVCRDGARMLGLACRAPSVEPIVVGVWPARGAQADSVRRGDGLSQPRELRVGANLHVGEGEELEITEDVPAPRVGLVVVGACTADMRARRARAQMTLLR